MEERQEEDLRGKGKYKEGGGSTRENRGWKRREEWKGQEKE